MAFEYPRSGELEGQITCSFRYITATGRIYAYWFQHVADGIIHEVSRHWKRIDLIFTRNLKHPAQIWTDTLSERLPSGVWASDHAGVVAHLVFLE